MCNNKLIFLLTFLPDSGALGKCQEGMSGACSNTIPCDKNTDATTLTEIRKQETTTWYNLKLLFEPS